jgi:hypothetical protein
MAHGAQLHKDSLPTTGSLADKTSVRTSNSKRILSGPEAQKKIKVARVSLLNGEIVSPAKPVIGHELG